MKWRQPADRRVVEAVVATFREPVDRALRLLSPLSEGQWERSLYWLDASDMALYFLARIESLGLEEVIPAPVYTRLKKNLADNRNRYSFLLAEFIELNCAFQQAGIDFCNLKGFTLSPESCPDPALRCQLDFDFLVDGRDLKLCREILAKTGYMRTVATATEWQFEAGSSEMARIEDHYKPRSQRSVELHFTCTDAKPHEPSRDERLDRMVLRAWNGLSFPVLTPEDQFVGQALHLLFHLRSACTRPSWLLEYKSSMSVRYDDRSFWDGVRERSQGTPRAAIAIGLATLLSTQLFGGDSPAQLNEWTLDRLPAPVRLWADMYGRKAVLADGPGTKLHLLLEDELTSGDNSWQKKRRSLLPLYCATRIAIEDPNESLGPRLRREYYQARFLLFRLRFHLVEGLRYAIEAVRWRRCLAQRQARLQPDPTPCISTEAEPS
jgi:Uncharacterised nucleotidyltransferase